MSRASRPRTNDERETLCRAIDSYLVRLDPNPVVADLFRNSLLPSATAWRNARSAWLGCDSALKAAGDSLDDAVSALETPLLLFSHTLQKANGYPVEISTLLGESLLGIQRLSIQRQLKCMIDFRTRLDSREFIFDPVRLATLDCALLRLSTTLSTQEEITRARKAASRAQDTAAGALDSATGRVSRAIRALIGEEDIWDVLPAFVRYAPKARKEGDVEGDPQP